MLRFIHGAIGLRLGSGQHAKCSHTQLTSEGKFIENPPPCRVQRESAAVCSYPNVSGLVILIFLMTPRISRIQASVQKNLAAPDRAEHTSKQSGSGSALTR